MYDPITELRALDILTGPHGSTVRVFIHGDDPETYYQGVLRERILIDTALEALVLDVGQQNGLTLPVTVRWAVVESLTVISPAESEAPS